MENQNVSGGRLTGMVRRWRKRPAVVETTQDSFFHSTANGSPASPDSFPALKPSPVHKELPKDPELTPDQAQALSDIEAAYEPGTSYLLTGHAGTGKTYLMQRLTKSMLANKRQVILSAPTHKAVTVLARKLAEAKIEGVACRTIHSVLSLKAKPQTDRLVFQRERGAEPVTADVVVIDECSMVDQDLFRHIKRHLPNSFVLFVGDPAQLPPVGEAESQTFRTPNRSHLTTIIRQAADNPILAAADVIRKSQGGASDLSWCVQASLASGHGVFVPGEAAYRWMRKAFTSPEFEADPDSFRYLAWTNERVAQSQRDDPALAVRQRHTHPVYAGGERTLSSTTGSRKDHGVRQQSGGQGRHDQPRDLPLRGGRGTRLVEMDRIGSLLGALPARC